MAGAGVPGALGLNAIGDVAFVGGLRDAVVEQITERIRCEEEARVAAEHRNLKVE